MHWIVEEQICSFLVEICFLKKNHIYHYMGSSCSNVVPTNQFVPRFSANKVSLYRFEWRKGGG